MKQLLVAVLSLLPATGLIADDARFDATARVGLTRYDDLDATDTAFGLGLGYRVTSWLAADGAFSHAPKNLGASGFSASRTEGSLGLRVGPRLDRTTFYVAARPGFVKFGGPDEAIACPAIFPPTLTCRLAEERVFTTDLTGGLQLVTARGVLRLEVGDRLAKYPNPTFGPADERIDKGMWTHNLAGSVAVGFRF